VIWDVGGPTVRSMPVEFLTDDEAAAYGRYAGTPSQEDIGQSFASTCRKSFSLTCGSFHGGVSSARPYATTRETPLALFGVWRPGCFTGPRL
jgi:hypothetical protein